MEKHELASLKRLRQYKNVRRVPTGEYQSAGYWDAVWTAVDIALRDHPDDKLHRAGQSLSEMELSPEEAAVIDDALADGAAKMPAVPPREDL